MGLQYLGGAENNVEEMVWASIIWAGGKMMERKWFGPPLFGRGGNNGEEMVWASIIWAGGRIMERKWFGPPLFGRGGKQWRGNGLGLHDFFACVLKCGVQLMPNIRNQKPCVSAIIT